VVKFFRALAFAGKSGIISMDFVIDMMKDADWEEVRSIYLEGIATGNATFETEAPAWEKWDAGHLPHSRLVARTPDAIKGWAALGPVSGRAVYRGVADVSIYVGTAHRGDGVGRRLLEALIDSSESNGIWTLQAGIFPENAASLALHRRCGFREVGRRERSGRMREVWRDTILLERRSLVVGV
jgi:L-amino acid N-acyltransferase YncA